MKAFTFISLFAFFFSFLENADVHPIMEDELCTEEDDSILIENNDVVYYVISKKDLKEFVKVQYLKVEKDILIETKQDISYLMIEEVDGPEVYKIPIDTKRLHIASSDLSKGKYAIKMKLKEEQKYIQTILKKS